MKKISFIYSRHDVKIINANSLASALSTAQEPKIAVESNGKILSCKLFPLTQGTNVQFNIEKMSFVIYYIPIVTRKFLTTILRQGYGIIIYSCKFSNYKELAEKYFNCEEIDDLGSYKLSIKNGKIG